MKKISFTLFAIAILIAGYVYFEYNEVLLGERRIAPSHLYPDTITQGAVATSDYKDLTIEYSGKSYSQFHRLITYKQKQEVCKQYNCKVAGQFDHFISIALGGGIETENIWYQPKVNIWDGENYGYSEKDRLEAYLIQEMKAKRLTPKKAQDMISKDWVRYYIKNIQGKGKFGGTEFNDGEDEIVDK